MTQAAACRACALGLREGARFCDGCGAPVTADPSLAEFKQVTILFADVVRSMDIAAHVGPERLREIMTDLFARSGDIVGRSGGYGAKVPVPADRWHTLRVEFVGSRFKVIFNAQAVFEVEDRTFSEAGQVGLWTKADSVTVFDNVSYGAER